MEDFLKVKSISDRRGDFYEQKEDLFFRKASGEKKKRTLFFVLKEIQKNPNYPSSLWANIRSPRLLLDLFSLRTKKTIPRVFEKKERQVFFFEDKPVGISPPRYGEWICAFLQFILFVPALYEMFFFLPSSLSPLLDCLVQYQKAQQEEKKVEARFAATVLEALRKKVIPAIDPKKEGFLNLYSLLEKIMEKVIDPQKPFPGDLLAFDPACRIYWDLEKDPFLWEGLGAYIKGKKVERLLLGLTPLLLKEPFLEKFFELEEELFLSAFVEYRAESPGEKGVYITYLFSSYTWYQCYQGYVMAVKKENLLLALQGAIILYYQKG